MVLEGLQEKFQGALRSLRGQAKLRPEHIEAALGEIKQSLLEADVQFGVVTRFLERVREKALGTEVLGSLTPYQQFLYVLQKEMTEVLGPEAELPVAFKPPVILLMAGLQGSGKTTSAAKLALYAKRKLKRKPLLVSVDVRRPAANDQLERLAKSIKVDSLNPASEDVFERASAALRYAEMYGLDFLIVDTAGRLSIDEELMAELETLKKKLSPQHVLYVADAMSGQAGLQVAEGFSARVGLTGAILSKADADSRGGVAFSIREALKVPLYFVGMGEGPEDFEAFRAERWIGRILGQGDLKTLVEKVEEAASASPSVKPEKLAKRALKGQFSLADFQQQMKMMSKMGSMESLMGMIPGMGQMASQIDSEQVEKKLKRVDALICSMTPGERARPDILNGSRKRRVARGSGTSVEELNQFLKEFFQMQKMMKGFKGGKGMGQLQKLFG